jgi:glutamate synthase domain-containing protein 3
MRIDATGLHYRELNERIRAALDAGYGQLVLEGVLGQRYIGTGISSPAAIEIRGVPGSDLAAFTDGAHIRVRGNAQDAVGNTMNAGTVIVHGHAGDLLGHSMRGGTVLVRDGAGYRVGIHMKAFGDRFPAVVVGGRVKDYAGEYMGGGILVILGLNGGGDDPPTGGYLGTGMHGGEIYVCGRVEDHQLGKEVGRSAVGEPQWAALLSYLELYCREFDRDPAAFAPEDFVRLTPSSHRPYGTLYVY